VNGLNSAWPRRFVRAQEKYGVSFASVSWPPQARQLPCRFSGNRRPAPRPASAFIALLAVVRWYAWCTGGGGAHLCAAERREAPTADHATVLAASAARLEDACHVTGAPSLAADEANANVRCETCHGPGRSHMQGDPETIRQKPDEKVCVACHSEKSPHFKFFSYAALVPLAHKTVK
jgi:hypothetical protein